MSELKAGDLALIIKAANPENIGKTVELIQLIPENSYYRDTKGVTLMNIQNAARWNCIGSNTATVISGSKEGLILPEWLMPLRGDFTPEEIREEELVKLIHSSLEFWR